MSWSVEALRASVVVASIKWSAMAGLRDGWSPVQFGQYQLGNDKLVQRKHMAEPDIAVSKFAGHPVVVLRDPLDGSYDLLVETRAIELAGLAEQVRRHVLGVTNRKRTDFVHKQGHFTEDSLTCISFRGIGRRPGEQSYYPIDRVLDVAQAVMIQDVSATLAQEMQSAIQLADETFD